MNQANVISVNPSVKTLGELHINDTALRSISRTLSGTLSGKSVDKRSCLKSIANFAFGINSGVNSSFSIKMMAVRVIAGVALLASTLLPMSPADLMAFNFDPLQTAGCLLGVSLIFGLFTRLTATAAAGGLTYLFVNALIGGQMEWLYGCGALTAGMFAILGPGIYCADQFIRKGLYKAAAPRRRRKSRQNAINYRAYQNLDKHLG